MALYSIQIERHVLSGLIQNPNVFAEIDRFVSDKDFVAEPHHVIYGCLRAAYVSNEKIDKVLLAQKIKNLGITFKDDVNIFDYIEAISFTPITSESTIAACRELAKLRVLRDIEKTCEVMKQEINKAANQPLSTTIATIDAIYGDKVNSFGFENEPSLLFNDVYALVEQRGNNPVIEVGFETPYAEFNRLYGGLRKKNLYIIVSRAKSGKSSVLVDMSCEMSRFHKMPVLILDTEMSSEEVKFRAAASKSSVGLWFLESGNWRKNENMIERVRSNLSNIHQNYQVYHMSIGNKKIEEVSAICRRWYLKTVGRGNNCLICYDYVKMMDKLDRNQQEYQLMGEKIDMLKKLSEELDCPILTAVQSNRIGITTNREASEIVDDESVIGISDRITWYATYVGILRRKTPDEVALDTPESGTHKLIEAVARFQGRDASGHQDYIQRRFPDGKTRYIKNYINFSIVNFRVEERGSLRDSIARQNSQFLVQDSPEVQAEAAQETLE